MANTLMFEVGVQEAKGQLTTLENRLKELVEKYGSMKIKVEVENLQAFINALKTIGDGKLLEPLLNRVDSLQQSLTKINGSVGNVDLSSLKKQLDAIAETEARIKKTKDDLTAKGQSSYISSATKADNIILENQIKTLERNFGMTVEAAKHYIKTSGEASDSSSKLNQKIEQLSQSISGLAAKTPTINLGGDFAKWAQEVNGVTAAVKELVTQMEKLHSVQGQEGAQTQQIDAQTQAVIKESEAYKQLAKWQEQAEQFHKRFGRTGLDIIDWHAESYIKSPATWHNGHGEAYNDLDTIRNHVYALKEEATLLNERQALINKYSSVSDVGQKQRYNQILSVYNEVYDAMQKLKQEESKPAPQSGIFDPQKFTTLQEAIDKIIGEINRLQKAFENLGKEGALSNLSTMIRGLALELSNMTTAIKLQPVDEQVKQLLQRAEQAEQKLREIAETSRYMNVRNGDRTQDKAADIQKIADAQKNANTETEKGAATVDTLGLKYSQLIQRIENWQAALSKLLSQGGHSNYFDEQLRSAIAQYQQLLEMARSINGGKAFNLNGKEFFLEADKDALSFLRQMLANLGTSFANVNKEAKAFNKAIEKDSKVAENSYNGVATKIADVTVRLDKYKTALDSAANMPISTTALDSQKAKVEELLRLLKQIEANKGLTNDGRTMKQVMQEYGQYIKYADHEMRNLNKSVREHQKSAGKDQATEALKEQLRVVREIRALGKTANTAEQLGLDASKVRQMIEQLEIYRKELKQIQETGGGYGGRNLLQAKAGWGGLFMYSDKENYALQGEIAKKKLENAAATTQLSQEEQKLAQALNQSNNQMRGQSQVLSDLKMLATQYLGVWGAQGFLKNIIEIGGQLEMQRLSIGAILQNQSQANSLFEKIKTLATQSPFGVIQLDQMTKQLTAYGFRYHELYDMTKRLADISAATGTGVDRLALALGHVRSEAALSGYTLRQFAMGNVPLLGKLAEKLGKTTEEIRKMVRGKQISYEDVVGVLKDLTNEGGMFHNMQEVISQSVKARYKNVKDAMEIMYGEMAEGGIGEGLKEVADVLMDVTKNWKDAATVIGTGAAVWGLQRAAILAYTQVLGVSNAQTLASIAAFRKKEAAQLWMAKAYRRLDSAEKSLIATSKIYTMQERIRMALGIPLTQKQKTRIAYTREQIIMDRALALSEKKLTAEDIVRQVALGKLTKAEATQILVLADLSAAERAAALSAVNNVRTYGRFTGVINVAAFAVRKLCMALKSLVLNPAMLMMAGITAITELWMRNNREIERAEELTNTLTDSSQEALKNTRAVMENTGVVALWKKDEKSKWEDVTSQFGNQFGGQRAIKLPKFDTSDAQTAIDQWTEYIRNYAATPNRILNEALADSTGKARTLEEQFYKLGEAFKVVAEAQNYTRNMAPAFESALDATNGGWLDDDLITNVEQYDAKVKKLNKDIVKAYKDSEKEINIGIRAALKQDEAFRQAAGSLGTYAAMFKELMTNQRKYTEGVKAFKGANDDSMDAWKDIRYGTWNAANNAKTDIKQDLQTYYQQLEGELNMHGISSETIRNNEAVQQAMLANYKKTLESAKGMTEETGKWLMEEFAKHFGIKIDADNELLKVKVKESVKILNELSGGKWDVSMNFSTTIDEVISESRKKYKAAVEYFNNVKPIMVKFGLDFEMGKELSQEQIEAAVGKAGEGETNPIRKFAIERSVRATLQGYNEQMKAYNLAVNNSKTLGFSLDDPNKGKHGGGNKEDKNAKAVREQVRIIKAAADAFQYWREKVGDAGAWEHVNAEFGKVLNDINITAKNVQDVSGNLDKVLLGSQFKAIKDKKVKEETEKEIAQEKDKLVRKDFEKEEKDNVSDLTLELDNLTKAWETFNEVREATGNVELAIDISGVAYERGKTRNFADALKEKIQANLDEISKEFGAQGLTLDLDINLSDEAVKDAVQNMFNERRPEKGSGEDQKAYEARLTKYQTNINRIVEAYKKWRDAQRDVLRKDISMFTKLVGSAKDYDSQLRQINDELARQLEQLDEVAKNNPEQQGAVDKAKRAANVEADDKRWKASLQYSQLMNNSLALTRQEVENGINIALDMLNQKMQQGLMTAQEYAEEIGKIRKVQSEWKANSFFGKNSAFGAGIVGGVSGRKAFYEAQLNKANANMAATKDPYAKEYYRRQAQGFQKKFEGAESLEKTLNSFDALSKAMDPVVNLFEQLGMNGVSNVLNAGQNALQSAVSMGNGAEALIEGAGPYGAAIGAGLSLVGSLIGDPDAEKQKQIEAIQAQIDALNANTEAIKNARERTLGYDAGDLRRRYADMNNYMMAWGAFNKQREVFGHTVTYLSPAGRAVNKAYNANVEGNGYSQELANLKEMRKDYIDMYDLEYSKKDSSSAALEEYKQKIMELDEQIMYFTQDLANELWGIDVKGWADQIGDALWTAFENGEDAAKAFGDTAKDIVSDVAKKMMNLSVIEPMFKRLQAALFGEWDNDTMSYQGGAIKYDSNGNIDMGASEGGVLKILGDYFGEGGELERSVQAAETFYNWVERITGMDFSKENDSSMSSNIKGITEDTAALLASYVNAIRADVSVNRAMVVEYYPQFLRTMTSGNASLRNIENHTAAIMRSNDAIDRSNQAILDRIDGLRNKTWKIPVA